jgi:quinol monooxygenase YgiN
MHRASALRFHVLPLARELLRNLSWGNPKEGAVAAFEVSAHMTVRPGQLEGFKKQAAECIRITKEKDTHTLRYDWFLTNDGTECEVRESYTDPEGLIEHNRNILEARTRLFKDYADNHFMTVYGDPTPELLALVKTHHLEHQFKWFSFVRGLDSSIM